MKFNNINFKQESDNGKDFHCLFCNRFLGNSCYNTIMTCDCGKKLVLCMGSPPVWKDSESTIPQILKMYSGLPEEYRIPFTEIIKV